ncbi:hypothetical protein MGSAQ_000478 [marine sediment metagenome]|uniref:Uncharacterized protein n=1 Tax=marine sediment metagenome TaxID=412755 RepID=A0A1B6NX58_9ZZZZ
MSCSARPSRRNSGLKITCSVPSRARTSRVKPTGTVDLTTITACGASRVTSRITSSTLEVLK